MIFFVITVFVDNVPSLSGNSAVPKKRTNMGEMMIKLENWCIVAQIAPEMFVGGKFQQ